MAKLHCLGCHKPANVSDWEDCPNCGARNKWAQPVEEESKEKNSLLVNSPAAFAAAKEIHEKLKNEEGTVPDANRGKCPRLSNLAARRLIETYREFDAFKASSMTRGGGKVIRSVA